jgi:hypothetical protein
VDEQLVDAEGRVHSAAFHFSLEQERTDGCWEASINWEDHETVIQFTLSQTNRDGNPQFKCVVVLARAKIDWYRENSSARGLLSYERQPLEGNPFHGNLLLKDRLEKRFRNQIAGALATLASAAIRRVQN